QPHPETAKQPPAQPPPATQSSQKTPTTHAAHEHQQTPSPARPESSPETRGGPNWCPDRPDTEAQPARRESPSSQSSATSQCPVSASPSQSQLTRLTSANLNNIRPHRHLIRQILNRPSRQRHLPIAAS